MEFSKQLKAYKEKENLTQQDMANRMGISLRMYQYYERGDYDGTPSKTKRYIDLLNKDFRETNSSSIVEEGTPIYEVSASASQMEHINQMPEVPAFTVKIPGYEDCNFGMYVYGHSMYPTIENGSLILCRKVNDKTVIMYGEIYLIRTADYLMVKRIQKNCKASVLLLLQHRPPLWRCQRLNLE